MKLPDCHCFQNDPVGSESLVDTIGAQIVTNLCDMMVVANVCEKAHEFIFAGVLCGLGSARIEGNTQTNRQAFIDALERMKEGAIERYDRSVAMGERENASLQ